MRGEPIEQSGLSVYESPLRTLDICVYACMQCTRVPH